ncbi:MAG: TVP38/TMEM64 family protein [Bacillota bacterium]|nr:TVP38/TMEM64 family protein [Bacillota bacterium]
MFIFATAKYAPRVTELVSKPEKFRDLLLSYGYKSVFIFIALQILQVVIAVIPGEVMQIAGGFVYGTILGSIYSIVGIMLGTVIVFYIVRLVGYPLVKTFVPHKNIEKFNFLINNQKSEVAVFILFLIPGIPKDALTYIAGLTPIKVLRFFITVTIARFPALIASSYIGTSLHDKNYILVGIVSLAAVCLFIAGLFLKDRIIKKLHSVMGKKEKE